MTKSKIERELNKLIEIHGDRYSVIRLHDADNNNALRRTITLGEYKKTVTNRAEFDDLVNTIKRGGIDISVRFKDEKDEQNEAGTN